MVEAIFGRLFRAEPWPESRLLVSAKAFFPPLCASLKVGRLASFTGKILAARDGDKADGSVAGVSVRR